MGLKVELNSIKETGLFLNRCRGYSYQRKIAFLL